MVDLIIDEQYIFDPKKELSNSNIEYDDKLYEEKMKKYFIEIPKYCYFLKNGYKTYKSKYELVAKDYEETKELKIMLSTRIDDLLIKVKEQSALLLQLRNENDSLKNKQIILDSYKLESESYFDLVKNDSLIKAEELEAISHENSNLKIQI